MSEAEFVDFYRVLQVDAGCGQKQLEMAYRQLAMMYHPDHPETADTDRFTEITEAYKALRDPAKRKEYDQLYFARLGNPADFAAAPGRLGFDDRAVLNDADAHERILLFLYKLRRRSPHSAGAGDWQLQSLLGCPQEDLDFHLWYLKEKGFVSVTDEGTFAITIQGIDHIISHSRGRQAETLLLAPARSAPADAATEAPEGSDES